MSTITTTTKTLPGPFLKWAGGKGRLLGTLLSWFLAAQATGAYHEPFLGGGALFFDLYRRGLLEGKRVFLSDMNESLIETYQGIREDVEEVIEMLQYHAARHSEDHYYKVRAWSPNTLSEKAARFIYLNKTCYNGLWRENLDGQFNVPFGSYINPKICDADNLRAVAEALQRVEIEQRDFCTVTEHATPGNFVYFDPPYDPMPGKKSFTAYTGKKFDKDEQVRLAEVVKTLDDMGVNVLLSNSDTEFIRELYSGFAIEQVYSARSINSKGGGRGKVPEVLVRNFGVGALNN